MSVGSTPTSLVEKNEEREPNTSGGEDCDIVEISKHRHWQKNIIMKIMISLSIKTIEKLGV